MIIPTTKSPSSSNPPPSGILIKEEKPNFIDILFHDSQDPWEEFTSIIHPIEALHVPFSSTTPPPGSHAPSTSTVPLIDSPTRQYYENLPWWKEPFAEVDSDVDNLSPSHSF